MRNHADHQGQPNFKGNEVESSCDCKVQRSTIFFSFSKLNKDILINISYLKLTFKHDNFHPLLLLKNIVSYDTFHNLGRNLETVPHFNTGGEGWSFNCGFARDSKD